jgi:glucokinase
MAILALDLGGTKLAAAVLDESGNIITQEVVSIGERRSTEVGALIIDLVRKYKGEGRSKIKGVGVSVPGISYKNEGTVWAPNIEGWENYPLLNELKEAAGDIIIDIDNDRACSILGELWVGNAKGCHDAIFLAVGTGIGAGIVSAANIIRGNNDIAGAIGWMALQKPYEKKYIPFGCFEYYSSGEGMARFAVELLHEETNYNGILREYQTSDITAHHIFAAYENNDLIAIKVIQACVENWGMATANLVSLFNPEKIIFGGGVFGPAVKFIPAIKAEADKWAQPISRTKVSFEASSLSGNASLYGAGYLVQKLIRYKKR